MNLAMRISILAFLGLVLGGCASGVKMSEVKEAPVVAGADQATVVFMRSSFVGSVVSASVWDVTGPQAQFVGIINNGTQFHYPVAPGSHRFMVVSEAADFMEADVAAGKHYYAMITPRMGVWKARFSFDPQTGAELDSADFKTWKSETTPVVLSPKAEAWAAKSKADAEKKRQEYWPKWTAKEAHQRESQSMKPADGR